MNLIDYRDLITIALGWAMWDLFVFALPKDNGYFSLKTNTGIFKWDFPHHVKILTLAILCYYNSHNLYFLIGCGCIAFFIQISVYNIPAQIFNKNRGV